MECRGGAVFGKGGSKIAANFAGMMKNAEMLRSRCAQDNKRPQQDKQRMTGFHKDDQRVEVKRASASSLFAAAPESIDLIAIGIASAM